MANMRAKVRVGSILPCGVNDQRETTSEKVTFHAVARNGSYPEGGADEDNTYARYSPSASFEILIANPALIGTFEVGEAYYVDFSKVEAQPAE